MVGETGTSALVYPYLMAVSTIITVPIIIAYFAAQRRFIEDINGALDEQVTTPEERLGEILVRMRVLATPRRRYAASTHTWDT